MRDSRGRVENVEVEKNTLVPKSSLLMAQFALCLWGIVSSYFHLFIYFLLLRSFVRATQEMKDDFFVGYWPCTVYWICCFLTH